ncbi:MAG: hypothetical protein Q7R33_04925 [Nitrosarchaeum sp.]|nr:hypothetical protein [Nitrosarchaeum sp.]
MIAKDADGNYILDINNQQINCGPIFAIAFEYSKTVTPSICLHKYGQPVFVKRWFDVAVKQFTILGFQDVADDLHYFESEIVPPNEFEKMINCAGYLPTFLINRL